MFLLGLLLPLAAAIGYPFRRHIYAAAGTALLAPPPPADEPTNQTVHFTYRPTIDPFATSVLALAGPGAVGAARVMALAALEDHRDTALVVIPRPDATMLFGLTEDELLDENTAELFIPGNLDAALAYLETELVVRQGDPDPKARRLLLVADTEEESDRIHRLVTRHPDGVSVLLLGDWTGGQATIDADGLVVAPPTMAAALPKRLPAMSRTEARDRLHAAIRRNLRPQKSGRRSASGQKRS